MAAYSISPQPPYTLAISSYAVHGVASLKTFIKILGSSILPVPSLILGGLTNIAGIKKFETPFEELLENTLELVVLRKQQIIFYTGYLGSPQQADIILRMIEKYSSHIKAVIADPVCGDNGQAYVPPDVIAKWPEIIKASDLVFPNLTELKLITGHAADATGKADIYIKRFKAMYPDTQLAISSYSANVVQTGVQLHSNNAIIEYYLPVLPQNFGGSGDLLMALFIKYRYYHNLSINDALKIAVDQTYETIKFSIAQGSDELLLNDKNFNTPLS